MGRSKILPRLKKLVAFQRRQDRTTTQILMNTFRSTKMLQDTRSILESNSDIIRKNGAEMKYLLQEKSDIILKTLKDGSNKAPSDFREIVDRAGDTTFLKTMGVFSSYKAAGGVLLFAVCWLIESHPEFKKIAEDTQRRFEALAPERGEWCKRLVERSPMEREACDWP